MTTLLSQKRVALEGARGEHERSVKHYWELLDRYDINRRTSAQRDEIEEAYNWCIVNKIRLDRAKSELADTERKFKVSIHDLPAL